MLGALSNVQTKVIFGIGRQDAEYFAKTIGRVDTEAVKRDPKTEVQHELFSPLAEQWEEWVDRLRYQPPRLATISTQEGRVVSIRTVSIPSYSATREHLEQVKLVSLGRHAVGFGRAVSQLHNIEDVRRSLNDRPPASAAYSW
jgi:hypothetical protein